METGVKYLNKCHVIKAFIIIIYCLTKIGSWLPVGPGTKNDCADEGQHEFIRK
jgi:hypothetical protein